MGMMKSSIVSDLGLRLAFENTHFRRNIPRGDRVVTKRTSPTENGSCDGNFSNFNTFGFRSSLAGGLWEAAGSGGAV